MAVLAQKSCTAKLAQKATRASAVRAPVVVVRAQKQNVESVEMVRTWSVLGRSTIAVPTKSSEKAAAADNQQQKHEVYISIMLEKGDLQMRTL